MKPSPEEMCGHFHVARDVLSDPRPIAFARKLLNVTAAHLVLRLLPDNRQRLLQTRSRRCAKARQTIEQIDVIQFDIEVKGKPLALKRARRAVEVLGRGGTSFTPVLAYIDEHRDYDGLIIFTDGLVSYL